MTQAVLLWVRCPGRSATAPTIRSPGRAPFVSVLAPLRVAPPVRPSHAHLHDENSCPLTAGRALDESSLTARIWRPARESLRSDAPPGGLSHDSPHPAG